MRTSYPEHTLTVRGVECRALFGNYIGGGRLAIRYVEAGSGEPMAALTVNLPGEILKTGEFLVKTWGGSEELSKVALASGIYEDTGRRVPTGHVEAQVWRFKDEAARQEVT